MTIRTNKFICGLTLMVGLICPLMVHAQNLTYIQTGGSGSTLVDFEWRLDGTFIENGIGASPNLPETGAGTRMFWYPAKAAFRAGMIDSMEPTFWDKSSLGYNSVAFNQDTKASGYDSAAFGQATQATGSSSVAFGYWNSAGGGNAAAFGNLTSATGPDSVSFGSYTSAGGSNSAVFGQYSQAYGANATALGYYTTATAYESFVIGQYNVGGGTSTSWVGTDPLFEIGNGTSSVHGDALVVYQNGNATVQGTLAAHSGLTCPQQGDLSMGSFTAGTAP